MRVPMFYPASSHDAQPESGSVIWAESRAEKKVEKQIAALGLSPWLPIVQERHWSDRWREVECPLFPDYLFAWATNADWHHQILRTPGVLTVITERGKPALLANSFVTSLRDAIGRESAAPEAVTESVDCVPGDEVIVQEGVLRGLRGIVRAIFMKPSIRFKHEPCGTPCPRASTNSISATRAPPAQRPHTLGQARQSVQPCAQQPISVTCELREFGTSRSRCGRA